MKFFQYLNKKWSHILLAACDKRKYESFTLYTIKGEEDFFALAIEALEALKEYDEIRYMRVKKFLPRIAFVKQGINCYKAEVEAFYVDWFPSDDAYFFASLFVHEATHGLMHKRGIPYDQQTKQRQENICFKEQFRFIMKVIKKQNTLTDTEKEQRINAWRNWFETAKKEGHEKNWALEGRLRRLKEITGSDSLVRFVKRLSSD